MKKKDFLVGVLYSGENEFTECISGINSQTGVSFDYFVIKNKLKKEAHTLLYKQFMQSHDDFLFFIKIDADMVIIDPSLFSNLKSHFTQNPDKDLIQFTLYDFFTGQYIWGVHCYRSSVCWPEKDNHVFTDTTPVPKEKRIYDEKLFSKSILHCPNPSNFQCFHYGVHRAAKIIQPGSKLKKRGASKNHWKNFTYLETQYKNMFDRRLGLAIIGHECIYAKILNDQNLNYSDKKSNKVFTFYNKLSDRFFQLALFFIRLYNFSFLPQSKRFTILKKLRS